MLRVLIAVVIALPLYELLRWQVLGRIRASLRDRARAYAAQHGVRVDLFKFGGKQLVREELLNDRAVVRAMMAAVELGERPTDVRDRVEEYIDEIVPAFSLAAYFEVGMRLARAAIGAVYRPVIVSPPPQLPSGATAVFLINHRSNFDYVVVGWALARQVAISYAVGEWARVFPLDALFKAFGGFFVRRGFPDALYHTVLRRYLQLITRRGVTQGIFPEGALSRDGGLRPAKVGLLDALLQLSDGCELYFVPVGINYDRVLEDEALLAELRGRKQPPTRGEKVRGALRLLFVVPWRLAVNLLRVATGRLHRHGYVAVAFGAPVRFRDLPQSREIASLTDEERRARAKEVAAILMQRVAQVIPATPVPLVSRAALDLMQVDGDTLRPSGGDGVPATGSAVGPSGGDGVPVTGSAIAQRVREIRAALEGRGVPTAMGREFDAQRAAREGLREDLARTRDLARLEEDLLAAEEAEQIVALGLPRLVSRGALQWRGGQIRLGPHRHAADLLSYYARSLDGPGERQDVRPLEARAAGRP
ncbi:MAG TPA: 1-acyl-sn-glycerol-3-phosphate acyltransferase [Myxococcales bacterium]|nr:1-acyl-sn-glycerol-3-phosphate acyltransferase [Myxococcales bacterium]